MVKPRRHLKTVCPGAATGEEGTELQQRPGKSHTPLHPFQCLTRLLTYGGEEACSIPYIHPLPAQLPAIQLSDAASATWFSAVIDHPSALTTASQAVFPNQHLAFLLANTFPLSPSPSLLPSRVFGEIASSANRTANTELLPIRQGKPRLKINPIAVKNRPLCSKIGDYTRKQT